MSRLRQIGGTIRNLWLILGVTLVFVVAIEAGLTLGFRVYDAMMPSEGDSRAAADAYSNAPWAQEYWTEFHRGRDDMRWVPYVYWRRPPWQSRYINVDEKGLRATPTSAKTGSVRILMFGGSTLWGTGARDEFTIPSILARELARKGVSSVVVNYGESGWVTTQELVALELALQHGQRADLVIFYDGINDTTSAFLQGVAGLPHNEHNRVSEFNFSRKSVKARLGLLGRDAALRLATRRLFDAFRSDTGKSAVVQRAEAAPGFLMDAGATARLARQVIDTYASNVELVKALGEHYQFKSLFYWQPAVSDKPNLTEYEKLCLVEMKPMEGFFRQTMQAFRDRRLADPGPYTIHDLTGIFAQTSGPMFVDSFHLAEMGNELIAQHMLPDVLAEIASRNGASGTAVPARASRRVAGH
jgi:lysophospholipase L1-like esterase